jgi:hypothetical protein
MKFSLANAIHVAFNVDAKVFVAGGRFERYGKVAELKLRMGKIMVFKCESLIMRLLDMKIENTKQADLWIEK